MKTKFTLCLASCMAIALLSVAVQADSEHCRAISAGAATSTNGAGFSFHNIGQSVIGLSSGPAGTAAHGSLHCLRLHTDCIPCDVNNDGKKDGLDVQGYVDFTLSGAGTPCESIAASPTIPEFVSCLLN